MNKIDVFIQARLTSTRLPKKVLIKFNNYNSLEIIHKRIKKNRYIDRIIFLIPNNYSNDELKKNLIKNKFLYFEGSELNVLDRYYKAALKYNSKNILRVTADCLFTSNKLINDISNEFFQKGYDFLSMIELLGQRRELSNFIPYPDLR